ncbi:MAG TPA: hypothetical protein VH498_03935 [Candidatus Dormibacteraeota bacterium]|nr:hypothetical protein [Candidatus Dormibacteraeota bacterium]
MTETPALDPGKIVADVMQLLAGALGELVPPDAQLHLLNAQRELLLALAVIIEHNSTRTPRRPRGRRRAPAETTARRPKRVELD